jgi:deoxyribodipyrimidine photo-lyase
MKSMEKINVFWMRRDIRLHDNHALYQALNANFPVVPLFILDTEILDELPIDDPRLNLIWQALKSLNDTLENQGKRLLIQHGKPLDVFKSLIHDFDIHAVFSNEDYEPYAKSRDAEIAAFLKTKSVEFQQFTDQLIFHPEHVLKSDGTPYQVFTPYMKSWRKAFQISKLPEYPSENLLKNLTNTVEEFPQLKDFGYQEKPIELPEPNWDESFIRNYEKTRDIPSINGTSRLSVHLRFGFVSIRKLIRYSFNLSDVFVNELIWREFYMMILYHFPQVVTSSFKPKYDYIKWQNNEAEFEKWCNGETGFPIVDAGMRQLNQSGYMHNRIRMITASFLVKDLLIDWRWGEAYFAEKLLDYDLAANNGGWQWAAGSGCDAAPYFRIFNPDSQQKKFDPKFEYIKQWIPEWETENYPQPMLNHKAARERALQIYKDGLQ